MILPRLEQELRAGDLFCNVFQGTDYGIRLAGDLQDGVGTGGIDGT